MERMLNLKVEKDIKIIIFRRIFEEMKRCVKKTFPNEAFGLIFGVIKEIENPDVKNDFFYHYFSKEFKCIKPDKKSIVSFLINDEEKLYNILNQYLTKGKENERLRLISIFHSHPSGTALSSTDIKNMQYLNDFSKTNSKYVSRAFKNLVWVIMDGKNYNLDGYILLSNELYKIDLIVKE